MPVTSLGHGVKEVINVYLWIPGSLVTAQMSFGSVKMGTLTCFFPYKLP